MYMFIYGILQYTYMCIYKYIHIYIYLYTCIHIYIHTHCDFNNLPLGYMEKSSCPLSSVAQRGLGGIRTIYGWPFRGKGRAGRHQSQGLFQQWIQGEDTPFSTLVVVQPFYTVGIRGFYRNIRVPYIILVCGTIGFQVDSSATTEFTLVAEQRLCRWSVDKTVLTTSGHRKQRDPGERFVDHSTSR